MGKFLKDLLIFFMSSIITLFGAIMFFVFMKGEMTITNCLIGVCGYFLAFNPATEFWGEKLRNLFTKKED
jgi:hypothetical protein